MRVEVRITCPGSKRLADEGCIMEMCKFDCMAVVGATGGEARVNGTRGAMLKKATQGKDVDVVANCPNKEVIGKRPNKGTIKSRHFLLLSSLTRWQNAYTGWYVLAARNEREKKKANRDEHSLNNTQPTKSPFSVLNTDQE